MKKLLIFYILAFLITSFIYSQTAGQTGGAAAGQAAGSTSGQSGLTFNITASQTGNLTYDHNLPHIPPALMEKLHEGILHYTQGNWQQAIEILQPVAQDPSKTIAGEALFWIALSNLSGNEYQKTINDIIRLEMLDPHSHRINELAYHKGRAFFHLAHYDEAIISLKKYFDSFDQDQFLSQSDLTKKYSALYWIGESLYAAGHLDRAADIFFQITNNYPQSNKFEASSYRIALINQKKIETELLDLLKWSHEESLRIMEEYQRRERAYDQAILSYQRRINDMLKDTRLADLEGANSQYQQQLSLAEERIRTLESRLAEVVEMASTRQTLENSNERLINLRTEAEDIKNELQRNLGDIYNARGTNR